MSSPEFIRPTTNQALVEAVASYDNTVRVPFITDVSGFAEEYLRVEDPEIQTLITSGAGHLAITAENPSDSIRLFVNVDLRTPDQDQAAIVRPGYYDRKGNPDRNGQMMRPVQQILTEREAQELIMDLYAIISRAPAERRK